MNTIQLRTRVLLTMQSALLGMVSKHMSAVVVSWTEEKINIRIAFDRVPTANDIELASEIETEVISHFPQHTVQCCAETSNPPMRIELSPNEALVFQRSVPDA